MQNYTEFQRNRKIALYKDSKTSKRKKVRITMVKRIEKDYKRNSQFFKIRHLLGLERTLILSKHVGL